MAFVCFAALTMSSSAGVPPDPFGDDTVAVFYGDLVTGWQLVRGRLIGDRALLGACVDSNTAPCAQARAMWRIINEAKEQHGLVRIGHINRAINLAIVPFEPSEWLTGLEAIHGAGDCQAYATAKYFALREAGIPAYRVRLVVVHLRGHVEDHMVTAVWRSGQWLILDNGTMTLVPDTDTKYTPLFVLDGEGVRRYMRTVPVS